MDPLAIFLIMLLWMGIAGIAVRIFRHVPTRVCPHCAVNVELGKAYCQGCGYKFTDARYWN